MSREAQLSEFATWVQQNITGDEKGQAQIFLHRLFQALGQPGMLDVGAQTEFRLRKAAEDGAFPNSRHPYFRRLHSPACPAMICRPNRLMRDATVWLILRLNQTRLINI